jgi:protein O-mannosyl-transferase
MENPFKTSNPKIWFSTVLIAAMVFICYWNTLNNEFVSFDDRKYIYENPLVIGDGGLKAIWMDLWNKNPKTHYNPLTYTTFWIEHKIFGIAPTGTDGKVYIGQPAHPVYHITQMLLHSINAVILIFVLHALGVGVYPAIITGMLFALHPINVASVAWVAERKNLLSGLFFWLSLLTYIFCRRNSKSRVSATSLPIGYYVLSLAFFQLALLSKSAALVLAPMIIITDRILDDRWTWDSVRRSAPFFALAFIIIWITASQEALLAKSWNPVEVWIRPFIAIAAIAHYVIKMFLPFNQAIIYPRWDLSLANPRYVLSIIFISALFFLIWRSRKTLPAVFFWALALFLVTVSPMLGLKHFIWMEFAFVSDHYMYLGSPGIILMAVLSVDVMRQKWLDKVPVLSDPVLNKSKRYGFNIALIPLLCLVIAICCFRIIDQNKTWKNNFTLWTHTLAVSPDCMIAHINLGNHYLRKGDFKDAFAHYSETARIDPDYALGKRNAARCLRYMNKTDDAIFWYKDAVETLDRESPRSWSVHTEYADYLLQLGRMEESLAEYKVILAKNPPDAGKIKQTIRMMESRINSRRVD